MPAATASWRSYVPAAAIAPRRRSGAANRMTRPDPPVYYPHSGSNRPAESIAEVVLRPPAGPSMRIVLDPSPPPEGSVLPRPDGSTRRRTTRVGECCRRRPRVLRLVNRLVRRVGGNMTRLLRWAFNFAALLSLVACVAIAWAWWHSYRDHGDRLGVRMAGVPYVLRSAEGRVTALYLPQANPRSPQALRQSIDALHDGDLQWYAQVTPHPRYLPIPGMGRIKQIGMAPPEGRLITIPNVHGLTRGQARVSTGRCWTRCWTRGGSPRCIWRSCTIRTRTDRLPPRIFTSHGTGSTGALKQHTVACVSNCRTEAVAGGTTPWPAKTSGPCITGRRPRTTPPKFLPSTPGGMTAWPCPPRRGHTGRSSVAPLVCRCFG